jgi:hypothetical protein
MPLLPFNRNFSTRRSPTQLATLVLSRPPAISRVAHSKHHLIPNVLYIIPHSFFGTLLFLCVLYGLA